MSQKPINRIQAIRLAGISVGSQESIRATAQGLRDQHEQRIAGQVFEVSNPETVTAGVVPCPRCNRATCTAKLSHGENVDYCPGCRYTVPRPGEDA